MPTVLLALLALLAALPAVAQAPEVAYAVDFTKGLQGWKPNGTAKTTEAKDGIVVTTNGVDPILVSPELDIEPRTGDVLEVTIAASRIGEIQWFWRVDKSGLYGGFSGEKCRTASTGAGEGFHTVTARAFWATDKHVKGLRFDLPEGGSGVYRIASLRVLRGPDALAAVWRREYRLPVSPKRIDVAKEKPPVTKPIASDYTVAMWYFAAWEPEYTWDGWQQVAERSPLRIPLLYDSNDPAMEYSGIRFYRSSNRTAVDWHVHWMREHAVNLMVWDWYPHVGSDGKFDPTFFGNRALEIGFLGKEKLGDPPAKTNRFAETMPFAIMWTNHAPSNAIAPGLIEYMVDQFMLQPNYYRIDGKPFVPLWSVSDLISGAGSREKARAVLDRLRDYAKRRGLPGVYISAVNNAGTRDELTKLGIDGVMGYNILLTGGSSAEYRKVGERMFEDRLEDFATQTIPGHEATWERMAKEFGRDYLIPTCPMQNWEPTFRPSSYIIRDHNPDGFRDMLKRARAFIEKRGLRKFVTVEAFNEWLEGSYVEPSTQWGTSYLEALRDVFGVKR